MLVGSIPLGIGTSSSDVDIIALIDSPNIVLNRGTKLEQHIFFSVQSTETKRSVAVAFLQGVEVDFLFVSSDCIKATFEASRGSRDSLTSSEIELLSRVKTGWILFQTSLFERASTALRSDNSLEVHCVVEYLVAAFKELEDAVAALSDNLDLAVHLGRNCVHWCFQAYFASQGYAIVGGKWIRFITVKSNGLVKPQNDFAPVSALGLSLFYPIRSKNQHEVVRYLSEVSGFFVQMRTLIEREPIFRIALTLSPFVDDPNVRLFERQ